MREQGLLHILKSFFQVNLVELVQKGIYYTGIGNFQF